MLSVIIRKKSEFCLHFSMPFYNFVLILFNKLKLLTVMKKIFSFVMLVAAVAMVSCGNCNQKKAECPENAECCVKTECCAECEKAAECPKAAEAAAESAPVEVAPAEAAK